MVGHTNPSMSVAFRFSLILIAGLALLVIATCGKDSPTKPTPPPQPPTPPPAQPVPTRITITPATTTLTSIGQTVQHSATVLDQNGQPVPGAVVTWSSSNAAVATVNSQGLVTAVMNGTAQITARSGNVSTSINVTVMQAAVRITITPITATLMAIGETVQFSAAVLDQNGQPVDGAVVTWSSSDEAVATVSPQGLVTAVSNGTAQITARAGNVSAQIQVMVMQEAGSIVIEPSAATLMAVGETVQFSAAVLDQNGQPVDGAVVTWSTSDEAVATVSPQGLVTAVSNGTAQITARAGNASASVTVTVAQSAVRITITPAEATLIALGETVQFSAAVLDQNGQPVDGAVVAWSSSDEAVATVSPQGLVTAVSNGTAQITARAENASAQVQVLVMQEAGSIVIEPAEATLIALGETVQFSAAVLDQNRQPVDGAVVTWSSSDEAVATVSPQGLVTAVSNGTAQITARAGNVSAQIQVMVMQEAGSIVIEPSAATLMAVGETVQFSAAVLDQNGQPVDGAVVTWSTSDEAVATVSPQGLVTAVSNGTAQITARAGNASASVTVTVAQSAVRITITPAEATLIALGETVQFSAAVLDQNGQPVDGAVVTWSSSDEAVATVSPQGLVTAVSNGTAQITARAGNASASVTVTVAQSAVRITITPAEATPIALGETVQFSAAVLDQNRQPVDGAVVTWSSSDEAVATVSPQGLVTAVSNGTAQITARAGNASASITVSVAQSAVRITITPAEATLMALGETVQFSAAVLDQNGQPVDGVVVTWSTSDEAVATVSPQGLVTAVSNGTAQITARAGNVSAQVQVMVMQEAGSIVIEPAEATLMALGETVQFSAAVLDQNGQPVDGVVVTWSTSDEAVATVSPQGLVTAVSNGTAQITARAGNVSAQVQVMVMQEAGSIVIEPAEATLIALGETVQFSAAVLDQNGQPVDGAVVAWLSSDEAVATVSPQGLVTAVMNGTVQITARSGTVSSHVTVQIMDVRRDRDALIALYHATNGPDWSNNTNWLSDHPLNTWNGVHTNSHGEVERLELNGNNLQGYLPHEITRLINLRWLLLGDNQLTGAIPPEFGQLQNLWQLYLVNNQLTGTIPIELGQLKNLYSLSLGKNQLTGVIPPELGRLEELRDLSLSNNQLTGTIPVELGQLKNLGTLNIGSNVLTGAIPSEIGQLSKLESLVVAGNFALSGPLPEELTKLENLELIVLENTQICVPPTTSFQEWLENIPIKIGVKHCTSTERDALNALYDRTDGTNWTNSTNWTSFTSTGDWFGVTTDADGKVTKLVLQDNNMSGTLPSLLSDLASLEVLDLSFNNGLEGNLPFSFTKLDLQELLLEGTQVCVPLIPEFQTWLNGIPHRNVSNCAETRRDYYPLAALYYSTNGQEWTNSTNWLSDAPLRTWHGVYTNSDGRVTSLFLSNNRLSGRIPPELGQLNNLVELSLSLNLLTGPIPPELGQLKNLTDLHLQGNRISEAIPSEIGQLENLKYLSLIGNRMTGAIPPEIGQLKNLTNLNLFGNKLTGSLPPELGQLHNLRNLDLEGNRLAGTIPSEIGQLRNLERLALGFNNLLSGDIPPEIGQLTNLTQLRLGYNALSGTIPAVLGKLRNLSELGLFRNSLEGVIPIEIGQLQNLRVLWLNENQLTGTIPPQLGDLRNLESLDLSSNHFTGEIPPELGQLIMLDELRLSYNELTGNIPISFADLASLKLLGLTGNSAMSGYLPRELIRLKLDEMLLGGTALCAPADAEFQGWIQTIPNSRVARCTVNQGGSTFYLTQATQSLRFPVPLVAGDDALLRVFLTSPIGVDATIPTVRATIFDRDFKVFDVDIPGNGVPIPQRINEGDLTTTANARIPGSIITPGIEMVIEIDPDGELDPSLGISGRMPVTGRTALDVREMPPFDLTLVPFLWTENPDYDFVNRVNALTSDDDLFRPTRDLLPVADFELSVREPVWIPVEPVFGNPIRRYVIAVRAMDGASGYYMGVLIGHGGGTNRKSPVITSGLQPSTIAHEFGHSMSLPHAPCGPVVGADPDYPYPDGTIGAWGYDLLEESLVNPDTPDLMSYCGPRRWISDYNFKKAMGFRLSEEQESLVASSFTPSTRSLLLWGGVNSSGEIILEPVFVVSAPPSPPQLGGLYEIVGEDQEGRTLFSVSFDMPEVEDAEEKAFAFILPVQTAWATSLQSITLSGPEGVSSLDGEDDPTAALLLDQSSGQVRGLLSDWPGPSTTLRAARRSPPEPGLEVVISKGVPEEEDWER